jgi:hypothetical protein
MRILWNVRKDLNYCCVGYIDIKEKYKWEEAIYIDYKINAAFKYELYIKGRFVSKYNTIERVQEVCYEWLENYVRSII